MKFNLSRPFLKQEISQIISKELIKQKIGVYRLTKNHLKELIEILEAIERDHLPKYFVRVKLSQELGYGIFLHPEAKPILKGQVIAPYAGEISLLPQNAPDDSTFAFDLLSGILLDK